MKHSSFSNRVLLVSKVVALTAVAMVGFGCADAVTFSRNAQSEGIGQFQQGDYVDASASFANAARQNPRDYLSYFYLGQSYQAMSEYQQAIGAYRSSLDVMPLTLKGNQDLATRYSAMDSLAQCIAKGGTASEEIAAREKKLSEKPSAGESVDDQWMLAKIYRYAGDADAAIEAYSKCVLVDPSRFAIAKEAGLYMYALGQNDRASYTLKKAYAVKTDDGQVNATLVKLGVVISTPKDLGAETHSLFWPA
jgi:tetratricopeptide (TPR) repeat protein